MYDSPVADALTMRWVPVVDGDGRTRLEARWSVAVSTATPAPTMLVSHAA